MGGGDERTIPEGFYRLLGTVPLLGTVAYGAGWFYFSSVYAQVGLAPEQVGITPGYVTIRMSILLLASLALGLGLLYAAGVAGAFRGAKEGERPKRLVGSVWLVGMSAGLAAGISAQYLLRNFPGIQVVVYPVSLVIGLWLVALLLQSIGFALGGRSLSDTISFGHALGAIVLMGVLAAFIAAGVGTWQGQKLRHHEPVNRLGVSARPACVVRARPMPEVCGLVLGQVEGFVAILGEDSLPKLIAVSTIRTVRYTER